MLGSVLTLLSQSINLGIQTEQVYNSKQKGESVCLAWIGDTGDTEWYSDTDPLNIATLLGVHNMYMPIIIPILTDHKRKLIL